MAEELTNLFGTEETATERTKVETTTEPAKVAETDKGKDNEPTQFMKTILAEMTRRAKTDDQLATGLKSEDKSIRECVDYLNMRAEQMITQSMRTGAVCIQVDDDEVYGWAVHYYTEDKATIDAEMPAKVAEEERKKRIEESKRIDEAKNKVYENPLLASLVKKGAKINAGEVAVTKTTTKKDENGNVVSSKSVKTDSEGTRTTSITKDGVTYTMTEFSLF